MKKLFIAAFVVCLLVIGISATAFALTASQTVTWTAPVTNTDATRFCSYTGETGCTSLDIASYTILWGPTNPPTNALVLTLTSATALLNMTYTVNGLPLNTVEYFQVFATNIYGTSAAPSNVLTVTTPKPAAPSAIANFAAGVAQIQ